MTEPSYRSDIRHKRVLVRVRRVAENRYRITDTKGRGLEYRKRQDFTADALSAIDAAESQEVWVAIPPSWSPNIVSFKTYTTGDAEGLALWDAVHDLANRS